MQFTATKRIVNQGHTLAVNLTRECRANGIQQGATVKVTVSTIDDDEQVVGYSNTPEVTADAGADNN